MRSDRCIIEERADSFLSNPNAGVFAGRRRMGTESLLDLLAERIADDSTANVVRVKDKNNLLEHIRSSMIAEKQNHILLYIEVGMEEFDLITKMFPSAHIYGAKELCHQVPVCFKEYISENSYGCELD